MGPVSELAFWADRRRDEAESNTSFAGRIREREGELLRKIGEALERIDQGDFGECSNCGEEFGVKRLLARPVARLCIECKDEQERIERQSPGRPYRS